MKKGIPNIVDYLSENYNIRYNTISSNNESKKIFSIKKTEEKFQDFIIYIELSDDIINTNLVYKIKSRIGANFLFPANTKHLEKLPFKIKVVNSDESKELFGDPVAFDKSSIIGQIIEPADYTIKGGYSAKLGLNEWTDFLSIKVGEKEYKYSIRDVEFIIPSYSNIKIPKNRNIVKGSIIIDKKNNSDSSGKVIEVIKNNDLPLIVGGVNTKKDTIIYRGQDTDKVYRTYYKYCKLINNENK